MSIVTKKYLASFYKSQIELNAFCNRAYGQSFVIAVDGRVLLLRKSERRKSVYLIGDRAPVPCIRASGHKVRRNERILPTFADSGSDPFPRLSIGP